MRVIHIAGPERNNLQKCVRCGVVLLNGRNAPTPPEYYLPDTLVSDGAIELIALDKMPSGAGLCNPGQFSEEVFPS